MTSRPSFWTTYGSPLLLIAACVVTAMALGGRQGGGNTDFLTFEQSGRQLLNGGDAYVPFNPDRGPNLNPPWVVAAMAPLSRLSTRSALFLWWGFSFACLFASAALIARTVAPGAGVSIASGVLVTQAAFSNLGLGQVAWPLMLLTTGAWRADRLRRPVLCGALLGVAASWKPFLLLFVPYLLWRRAWRSLAAMAAVITVMIFAGLAMVGVSGYSSWFTSLRLVFWEEILLNASLRGLLTRTLSQPSLVGHTTPIVSAPLMRTALWVTISTALAAATAWQIERSPNIDRAWASLSLLALLISPLGWVHYVPIATGPLVATLIVGRPLARWVGGVGWLLLCVPFLWLKDQEFGPWLTLTLASSYAWGTLLLFAGVWLSETSSRPDARVSVEEPAAQ